MCVTYYTDGENMFEYLAKGFAEVLTKGDVFELFKMLEQRYGTILKVCERIGIERKTFYHWRSARQINIETKIKVLKVALEDHPIDTLEFLARKTKGKTKEALEFLLEFLRREILTEEKPEKLEDLVKKAEEIIDEYSIPLIEYLRHEVDSLVEAVHSRGYEFRITPITPIGIPSIQAIKAVPEQPAWASSATMYQYAGISIEKPFETPQVDFQISESLGGDVKWITR